jgi:DNA polymerase III alpha subunit
MGRKYDIPSWPPNAANYPAAGRTRRTHEIRLCIQTGKDLIEDPGRNGASRRDEFYFKSPRGDGGTVPVFAPVALGKTPSASPNGAISPSSSTRTTSPASELDPGNSPAEPISPRLAREGLERHSLDPSSGKGPEVGKVYEKRLQSELVIIRDLGFPGISSSFPIS